MYSSLKNSNSRTLKPVTPYHHICISTHTLSISLSLTHTHTHTHTQIAAELVCDNDDDFSVLCNLIKLTNLIDDWTNENVAWTVFAPTNDAFATMMGPAAEGNLTTEELIDVLVNETLVGGLFDNPENLLKQILQFHAVEDKKLLSTDLPCQAGENLITMPNGKNARIMCKAGSPAGIKGSGNNVAADFNVTDVDVTACNGVIHVIDDVLLFDELYINQDRMEDG